MEIDGDLIEKTATYVKAKMAGEPTGHDWFHIERVWRTAKLLQQSEGGDLEVVELAALLHDLGDYKQYAFNEIKGYFVLRGMMDILGIEDELKNRLVKIIDEAQFRGDDTITPTSIEAKILQDADWLEALGAIGIARIFATGGSIQRVLHDPSKKPREVIGKVEYQRRKHEGTSYNYFFEKVLKLPKMMSTATGRALAEERARYTLEFLDEFGSEWRGEK